MVSNRVFYVGSADRASAKLNGYVRSQFLAINGQPVVDPTPGGSQKPYIYQDPSDRYKIDGRIANPNNYLIVPEKFNEQRARDYTGQCPTRNGWQVILVLARRAKFLLARSAMAKASPAGYRRCTTSIPRTRRSRLHSSKPRGDPSSLLTSRCRNGPFHLRSLIRTNCRPVWPQWPRRS